MGVLSGAMNYLRYRVEGTPKLPLVENLEMAFEMRRFVSLKPQGEDVESFGWVPTQKAYVDHVALTNDKFLFGERVMFGYREDQITYPRQMVKELVEDRIEKYAKDKGEEPSYQTKHAIELAIRSEIRIKILPKSKVTDVLWDLEREELRFFARGQGLNERFIKFFQESFELKLSPKGFSELAMLEDLSLRSKAMLETLKPIEIFPKRVVRELEG